LAFLRRHLDDADAVLAAHRHLRRRIVSTMAATIATSSSTAASSKGYRYFV
jgi:hypothetical protein